MQSSVLGVSVRVYESVRGEDVNRGSDCQRNADPCSRFDLVRIGIPARVPWDPSHSHYSSRHVLLSMSAEELAWTGHIRHAITKLLEGVMD